MILITGHLGFIGSYLTKKIGNFVGLDIKDGNDILTCDLPDAEVVIHLAAEPGVVKSIEEPYKKRLFLLMGCQNIAVKNILNCYVIII